MLNVMLNLAKETNRRAKDDEAKVHSIEEKVALVASHAIEDFKNLEDFNIKVGEVVYDAYLKGFTKCNVKVSGAFSNFDLWGIIAEDKEEEEEIEVEDENEATDKTLIAKVKEAKVMAAVGTTTITDRRAREDYDWGYYWKG